MEAGSPDKVVYEAAAACLPVLARTAPVETVTRFETAEELARRIADLAAAPAAERERLGRAGREEVRRRHSVDSWAEGVLAAL
jgi:glycosyltransferase involved in cell wall biosynthesis